MAKALFKPLPLNSPELFSVDIFERIPENHPVHLISDVVNQLDISKIMAEYKGGGTTAFAPRMMLKVLFYSYLSNVYSCRKIAKALNEKRNATRIHFMWISGNSTPDFRTINNFRGQKLKDHIHDLFAEVVKMLQALEVLSLDIRYIDGTKIESAANKYTFVWRGSVEKNKAKLEEKIKKVLGLQLPYWSKSKIAPCKSLKYSNLQGIFFRLHFYISKPSISQYQIVSCCYSTT